MSGNPAAALHHIHLALDPCPETIEEARVLGANALFTHHPLLLRGIHTAAEDTGKGMLLAALHRADLALYSAHTNADIPPGGVSDVLALKLGVQDAQPLEAKELGGLGRHGVLEKEMTLIEFANRVAAVLSPTAGGVRVAGSPDRVIRTVSVLGGAGDGFLAHPLVRASDVYVTSDLRHHPASDAVTEAATAGGPALIDTAHWASESLWLKHAACALSTALPGVRVTVSEICTDPWTFRVGQRFGL